MIVEKLSYGADCSLCWGIYQSISQDYRSDDGHSMYGNRRNLIYQLTSDGWEVNEVNIICKKCVEEGMKNDRV